MSNLRWSRDSGGMYLYDGDGASDFTWGMLHKSHDGWLLTVWRVGAVSGDSHWDHGVAEFATLQEAKDVGRMICAIELSKFKQRIDRRKLHG